MHASVLPTDPRLDRPIPHMTPIPRIAPPSAEEFEAEYVQRSRPVILRGAIDDWPAMRRWSPAYFKERFGDREVPVARAKNGLTYNVKDGVHYEPIRVGAFVDQLAPGVPSSLYMVFRVHEVMPELFDDVIRPVYCRDAPWCRSRFWFAGPDAKGPLHRDLTDNLYAQIVGRKRLILLDRRLTKMVDRYSLFSGVPNYSPVDTEAPDLARHPRFRGAPLVFADVEPGDLFYLPRLWWHQVRSVDTSISINFWWVRGAMVAVARGAELFQRVRRLRL